MLDQDPHDGAARGGELKTVARALAVLESFTDDHPVWGVTELAQQLGLDKSQVHRILTTLTRHGFTAADPETRRYSLGLRLVELGRRAEWSPGLRTRLAVHVDELAAATGESAVVCVPDGFRYRTLVARDGQGPIRYNTEIGRSYPGHLGASGHAIFALFDASIAHDLLRAEGAEPSPEALAALTARHERARREGYAVSDGEFDPRVTTVAAPLVLGEQVFGSVGVLGPRGHMKEPADRLVAYVLATAGRIVDELRTTHDPAPSRLAPNRD